MSASVDELWDVIIYEKTTGQVISMPGERMRRANGFYNAEKRRDTVEERCNEHYGVEIIPTGTAGIGAVLGHLAE